MTSPHELQHEHGGQHERNRGERVQTDGEGDGSGPKVGGTGDGAKGQEKGRTTRAGSNTAKTRASFSMHIVIHQTTVLLMYREKMFAFLRASSVDMTSAGETKVHPILSDIS